jgi:hypothetical protein
MQGFPAQSYVELYRRADRSVWVQELEMPAEARRQLQQFLEWNERPENRFYHYDYYRDNCSTRVRDALDRVLGGRIRKETSQLATGRTYRFHTRRLTANDPLIYTGLLLALGQPVESGATPPPDRPPFWLPIYLGIGLALGSTIFMLGTKAHRHRLARAGLIAMSGAWALVAGIVGLLLAGLWGLTDHTAAYNNENLFQANLLSLALIWMVPKAARGSPKGRAALILGGIIVGLSLLGLVLKLLPAFYQVNGEIIALALPVHLGVAAAIWQLRRSRGGLSGKTLASAESGGERAPRL